MGHEPAKAAAPEPLVVDEMVLAQLMCFDGSHQSRFKDASRSFQIIFASGDGLQ